MAHVLVTGRTGFIGTRLVEELLRRGDRVRCLVRSPERGKSLADLGAELVTGDLDQTTALAQAAADVEIVYHLAGLTKTLHPEDMIRVNRDGTANLMQACADQPRPPVVVLVSSIAAAGPAPRGQIRTEADPPAPVSNYGKSKLAGEQVAEKRAGPRAADDHAAGHGFWPARFGHARRVSEPAAVPVARYAGPAAAPSLVDLIDDLVELLIRAAQRGARVPAGGNGTPGQGRYFGVGPEYLTWAEMGRIVRPMVGRPFALLIPFPGPLAWCVAGIGESVARLQGKPRWLNYDKIREALAPSWACSCEAAKRDLGFEPPKSLALRFEETIDWYKQEGLLKSGFLRPY